MKRIIIIMIFLVSTTSAFCQTSRLEEGKKCFDNGDYACAIEIFQEVSNTATGKDKQIAELNITRAQSCKEWLEQADQAFIQKEIKTAQNYYQNVLDENPNDPHTKARLEECAKALISLKVSRNTLAFPSSGGKETLRVTTEAESYSIGSYPSWISVNKEKENLTVSAIANPDKTARSGYILVKAGNKSERININQKQKEPEIFLTTSIQEVIFKAEGSRTIIDVKTNASNFNVTDLPVWCKVSKKEGEWFSLITQVNNTGRLRKGKIKVSAGDKEVWIKISQDKWSSTTTSSSSKKATPTSTSSNRAPAKTSTKRKNCFNCPNTNDAWGLTFGYIQMAYDPFEQNTISPEALWTGMQFGLRYNPLFKYGFGLNTGIFLETYKNDSESPLRVDFDFGRHSLNIPLHLEYRFNFSRGFNIFAYGGAGFNVVANSQFNEYALPATFDYGAGLRINRVQFNVGQSKYMGSYRDMPNIEENVRNMGIDAVMYQDFIVTMSYMF